MTELRDLLERAAPPVPPPPDGLARARRRARSMRRRALATGIATVPLTALLVLATLDAARHSSDVRTVPAEAGDPSPTTLPGAVDPTPTTAAARASSNGGPGPRSRPADASTGSKSVAATGAAAAVTRAPRMALMDSSGVWTLDFDGTDRRRVYSSARRTRGWSPDGRRLLVDWGSGGNHIAVLDIDTGVISALLDFPGFAFHDADFSPDGSRLAYSATEAGGSGSDQSPPSYVFVAGADGRNARRLPYRGRGAVWSPDSARIAFECDHDEERNINMGMCTMAGDGTDLRRIADDHGPMAWSPDGQWLAVFSTNNQIRVLRPDGTGGRLVSLASKWSRPAWTPDSKRVIYSRSVQSPRFGVCTSPCEPPGIYSSAIDGSGHVRLTTSDWDMYPVSPTR